MNEHRSPTGCGHSDRLGGSQPNLSELNPNYDTTPIRITQRVKRKVLDDDAWIKTELSDLKKQVSEIMVILKATSVSQAENINKLHEDVTTIKTHVNSIGDTIESIKLDQSNTKLRLNELETKTENIEKKIENLETDLNQFRETTTLSTITTATEPSISYEEIVNEVHERHQRSKNIVILGIPEPTSPINRFTYNKVEITKITKSIYPDCPEPNKTFRLGKYKPGINRPIKACYTSENTVKTILRNKSNLQMDTIKIFSDRTPLQKQHFQKLKEELKSRKTEGETNLAIKYIKGVPKITQTTGEKQGKETSKSKN